MYADTCFVLPRTHQWLGLTSREQLMSPKCSKHQLMNFAKMLVAWWTNKKYSVLIWYIDIDRYIDICPIRPILSRCLTHLVVHMLNVTHLSAECRKVFWAYQMRKEKKSGFMFSYNYPLDFSVCCSLQFVTVATNRDPIKELIVSFIFHAIYSLIPLAKNSVTTNHVIS